MATILSGVSEKVLTIFLFHAVIFRYFIVACYSNIRSVRYAFLSYLANDLIFSKYTPVNKKYLDLEMSITVKYILKKRTEINK